jgi:hypothetical protein
MLAVRESVQMTNWVGVAIGFIALLFAVYEYRRRTRVETIVRNTLRRLAGEVRVVYSNAKWADQHLRVIGHQFAENTPDLTKIRHQAVDGGRDAAVCARQVALVHSQIRGIQQSLFNDTEEEILPEIQSDDVKEAQLQVLPSPINNASPLAEQDQQKPA